MWRRLFTFVTHLFKEKQMKKGFNILMIVCAALLALSCSKTKSYTDMLKDQKKAIDRLKDKEGFVFLKDFPRDSIFKENEFVELENGVYLNIIDKGTSERAVAGRTKILYRCTMYYPMNTAYIDARDSYSRPITPYGYYLVSDSSYISSNYGPHSNGTSPYSFTYGDYTSSNVGEGLMTPLQYVGDRAKIKLIVPFKRGLPADNSNGEPAYYEILEYKFEKNL